MDEVTSFGYWVRRRRKALDLTQVVLGTRVGLSVAMIRRLEADERRPSREVAVRLAQVLEVPVSERDLFLRVARAQLVPEGLGSPHLVAVGGSKYASPARGSASLPVPSTPLVGREAETVTLGELLKPGGTRLVTLTGAGGTGKTRLALHVAAGLSDDFAAGACFVDLAPTRDPALVPSTIARALDVKEVMGQPLVDALTVYVRDKQLLLILDNFEHVLFAAPLVADLLRDAPRLTVLVTSRAVLHLYGEQEYTVPPLALPDLRHLPVIEELRQIAAVRLFIQRTRLVKPEFRLTPDNASTVAQICAKLDGLPLALELATARMKLVSAQVLLARLENSLTLLTGGAHDLPARQHTMRATIEWSYNLLTTEEQQLFVRLGVFTGGCTLEAAAAVCPVASELQSDVLDGLGALVDQSLVRQQEGADGESRFTMLETIHEYALERLEETGEAATLHERHARYYLARLEALLARYPREQRGMLMDRMHTEMSNLATTAQWIRDEGNVELAVRWYDAAEPFGSIFSLVSIHQAWGRWHQMLMDSRETVPLQVRAKALIRIGTFAWYHGDLPQAAAILEEALTLTRTLDDPVELIFALVNLGDAYRDQELYARAAPLYEESLALAQARGEELGIAVGYHVMGELALLQEDYPRAFALEQASLPRFRVLDVESGITVALINSGFAAMHQGDHKVAVQCFDEGVRRARSHQLSEFIPGCLVGFAALAADQGQGQRASRLLAAAALQEVDGLYVVHLYRREYERIMAPARAGLDAVAWDAAWVEGQAMTQEQAVAYALDETASA